MLPEAADPECSERLARARLCAERGQWPLAEQLYREVIGRMPEHVDALEGLGLAALAARRPAEALAWLERARQRAPKNARIVGNLGLALRHNGQLERALVRYEEACALDPSETTVLVNRARAEREAGRLCLAIASFRRAAELRPKVAGIWSMLSNALREAQRCTEALEAARHALALDPWFCEAHLNEGAALHGLGTPGAAAASYIVAASNAGLRRAALANLAAALHGALPAGALGAPATALARRLLDAGPAAEAPLGAHDAPHLLELGRQQLRDQRPATAILCLEWARQLEPNAAAERELAELLWRERHDRAALDRLFGVLEREPPDARNHRLLGAFLSERGSIRAELPRWSAALASCPADIEALIRLGAAAQRLERPSEATQLYERLVRLAPQLGAAHFYLGSSLTKQGRFVEAQPAYRRALELEPERLVSYSNLLFTLHFDPALDRQAIFEEHRAFGERLEALADTESSPARSIEPGELERPLRVGYVSPDLCAHPVAHFLEPVLREHDRSAIEVHCYSDVPRPDAITERLARLVPHFTACAGWSHDALFERIRADRIDVLVDLAGHTAKNRLPVFARRASPVQAAWLGYFDTTGLSAIDYRIADAHSVPVEAERYFVERVLRLPRSANCYQPPEAFEPGPAPCLERGYVRFGYFNNPTKLGRHVVAAFARILRALPNSRMLFKYRAFDDPGLQVRILGWLAEEQIDVGRIQIEGHSSMQRFLRTLTEVDIALDPFPYSGETTALHALWMGVPVVTLEGPALVQRLASRVLRVAGLDEWVAGDVDEYVCIASRLGRDQGEIGRIRRELRARVEACPLLDHRGVTRELEAAYRQMWRARCAAGLARRPVSES